MNRNTTNWIYYLIFPPAWPYLIALVIWSLSERLEKPRNTTRGNYRGRNNR